MAHHRRHTRAPLRAPSHRYLTLETAYAWSGTGIQFETDEAATELGADDAGGEDEGEVSMVETAQVVTDVVWSMVESLPVRDPSLEVERPDLGILQDSIDELETRLRLSDVLHR